MAYLTFHVKGRELGRRRLEGPLVIGRAADCDVCVHDILLSRRHCQFQPDGAGWAVVDLGSKNGTHRASKAIDRFVLNDGEELRIGKTTIRYSSGTFVPKPRSASAGKPERPKRPADPWAAMGDTLSGFDYVKDRTEQKQQKIGAKARAAQSLPVGVFARMPTPQPTPKEPAAYESEDVYALLTELASSSWDSIYMNASRPAPRRPAPRPMVGHGRHPRTAAGAGDQLALQATGGLLGQTGVPTRQPRRWHRALRRAARGVAAVGKTVMVMGLVHLIGKI
ncbi:MAG TPA: FHA domain-containing protein [Tepidisphaeraceae bacterium]|jgi:pSer/pThr/pTyr-binding forkhead associated (FHA) protein|nr:FHA domain-containing protein [Tepidisphaeraceae bacterium]